MRFPLAAIQAVTCCATDIFISPATNCGSYLGLFDVVIFLPREWDDSGRKSLTCLALPLERTFFIDVLLFSFRNKKRTGLISESSKRKPREIIYHSCCSIWPLCSVIVLYQFCHVCVFVTMHITCTHSATVEVAILDSALRMFERQDRYDNREGEGWILQARRYWWDLTFFAVPTVRCILLLTCILPS